MCINAGIIFECRVTDALSLTFNIDGALHTFLNSGQVNLAPMDLNGFLVQLIGAIDDTDYNATATLSSVQLNNNGTSVICSGGSDSEEQILAVRGMLQVSKYGWGSH